MYQFTAIHFTKNCENSPYYFSYSYNEGGLSTDIDNKLKAIFVINKLYRDNFEHYLEYKINLRFNFVGEVK